ncbi:class F sortase [Nocardioides sp.]|jgi:LPXTG-site transpeptidase (sortase) family protein|uniref:class F sortase n=1 Tax=Nocardioides sp. TaxID=35761 RepID=UPI0026025508|nr:class F sortase [Nocardioides sp.]
MNAAPTPSRANPSRFARLGRYLAAGVTGLQLLIAVLAGGSVIGAFLVPGGSEPAAASPTAIQEAVSAGAPMRLEMPSLKVSAPVVPIAMVDNALDPPRDYLEVGWWNASAKPGAEQGQIVITGHTLHTGGASMNNLGRLAKRDRVDVVTKRGTLPYVVTATTVLSKEQLSRRSAELFGQDHGHGRLVLITCSDWNGSYYETNTVVFARPKA